MRVVLQNDAWEEAVHGEMIDALQKFKGGRDWLDVRHITVRHYEPACDIWHLTGPRSRLILFPRGHMKTTIITIAHTIQWVINYPDIRIIISTAIGEQAIRIMQSIKSVFQFNENFRYLFPEFCPAAKDSAEFGTQDAFTVPNRKKKWLKEPTVGVVTLGKVIAGGHYEVIKHSDLVDKENVRTPQQIQQVIDHFGYMEPLLERGPVAPHHGWMDVEGTRYDFSDLYSMLIDSDKAANLTKQTHDWQILVRAAIKEDGESLWPAWFPLSELERIRRNPTVGDAIFSAQYLNNPIPASGGLCGPDKIVFTPADVIKQLLPRLRLHVTIDLHGMEANVDNDYTVITLAGFDSDGRIYVLEIHRDRFTPFEIINAIFNLHQKYPKIIDFKMEKDAHARVLAPFIERERMKRRRYPMLVFVRRDNRQSKQNRIRGLQPFFERGDIRFSASIDGQTRLSLIDEVVRFPSYIHDDILDTLADQLQNRDGDGVNYDLYPGPSRAPKFGEKPAVAHFTGFDPRSKKPMWTDDGDGANVEEAYDKKTGM